jgi:[acyl-carrier-protein] S-malonyltransferase
MTAALTVGHGHGHSYAPVAPPEVMAYLNGEPVLRELLDDRLAVLRAGDAACVLPRPDSREGRQLTRWVAQVVLTEQLSHDELRRRADAVPATSFESAGEVEPAGGVGEPDPIDVSTAIAVGSITAAALAGSEAVRRVAALVTADIWIPADQLAYAADVLGQEPPADPDVPVADWHRELLQSARLEAFARWLNAAMHDRVQLVHGLEHPGDSSQPDNLHRH